MQVAALQAQLAATQAELASLQAQVELSQKRLTRAGKLTSALQDEVGRWGATAEALGARLAVLLSDVLLAAACVSYTGAFPGERCALPGKHTAAPLRVGVKVCSAGFEGC